MEYRGVLCHTLHLAASHHCCASALWVCCSFEDEVTSIVPCMVPVFISVDFEFSVAVQCSLRYKCCATNFLVMPSAIVHCSHPSSTHSSAQPILVKFPHLDTIQTLHSSIQHWLGGGWQLSASHHHIHTFVRSHESTYSISKQQPIQSRQKMST